MDKISIFGSRRDLRLKTITGIISSIRIRKKVLQFIFIFDEDILDLLENKSDKRADFIVQIANPEFFFPNRKAPKSKGTS